jgi:hypothetical protein
MVMPTPPFYTPTTHSVFSCSRCYLETLMHKNHPVLVSSFCVTHVLIYKQQWRCTGVIAKLYCDINKYFQNHMPLFWRISMIWDLFHCVINDNIDDWWSMKVDNNKNDGWKSIHFSCSSCCISNNVHDQWTNIMFVGWS